MNAEPKNNVPATASVPASVQTIDVGPTTASEAVGADAPPPSTDATPSETKTAAGQPAAASPERRAATGSEDHSGDRYRRHEGQDPGHGPDRAHRSSRRAREFTPARLVETVQKHSKGWEYEAISIGYPGLVGSQGPRSEPGNLGPGWVGFDFAAAFGKPVKMVNDAAMQALGSYEGGRMLFLGLGTGLGLGADRRAHDHPAGTGTADLRQEANARRSAGPRRDCASWASPSGAQAVSRVVTAMMHAFVADYVVIGGGNAKQVVDLPPAHRLGHNLTAFRGGFRLWSVEDVWVLAAPGEDIPQPGPALRMQ